MIEAQNRRNSGAIGSFLTATRPAVSIAPPFKENQNGAIGRPFGFLCFLAHWRNSGAIVAQWRNSVVSASSTAAPRAVNSDGFAYCALCARARASGAAALPAGRGPGIRSDSLINQQRDASGRCAVPPITYRCFASRRSHMNADLAKHRQSAVPGALCRQSRQGCLLLGARGGWRAGGAPIRAARGAARDRWAHSDYF